MDEKVYISQLKSIVKKFCEVRDWNQYHNPKDLAIGIITEASELLECFRFKSESEMENMLQDIEKRNVIAEELSDILFFLLRFVQKYDFDISSEFLKKISINEEKYPVSKFKGSNKKYTEV